MKRVLVAGAKGFIGKNLVFELQNRGFEQVFQYDLDTGDGLLDEYCRDAEFVFNLAGVNRPQDPKEFEEGNRDFVAVLTGMLKKHKNTCHVLMSSSTQAGLDNPYGKSKKAGEDLLISYGEDTGAKVYVYRLPNVFGKWCRPDYNSAVATFCHNIARGLPVKVSDPNHIMNLVYIDDVVNEFIKAADGDVSRYPNGYCCVPEVHTIALGRIPEILSSFKSERGKLGVPDMKDEFVRKLYATFLSYLPEESFNYPLRMNRDERGSFTEIFRTEGRGQFSVNISKPGIIKGNHWHNTKNEKFVVVSGEGVIRLRSVLGGDVLEYFVSGDNIEVVDIPPGYTHNIENLGNTDMVTIMWCSECFDPERMDTNALAVSS